MTQFVLTSGNLFCYYPETVTHVAMGIYKTPNGEFIGGVLSKEATRKMNTCIQLKCHCMQFNEEKPNLSMLRLDSFACKLNEPFRGHFVDAYQRNIWISDYYDCDGQLSRSGSCSDRFNYYRAAGLDIERSKKQFPLLLFLANHIAIFNMSKSLNVYTEGVPLTRNRYGLHVSQAPYTYVRLLLRNS